MIGTSEVMVILIIALLLFGPKKLPELTRSLGKAVAEYHKSVRKFEGEITKTKKQVFEEVSPETKDNSSKNIKKIARNLGIPVKNRSDHVLLKEIARNTEQRIDEIAKNNSNAELLKKIAKKSKTKD